MSLNIHSSDLSLKINLKERTNFWSQSNFICWGLHCLGGVHWSHQYCPLSWNAHCVTGRIQWRWEGHPDGKTLGQWPAVLQVITTLAWRTAVQSNTSRKRTPLVRAQTLSLTSLKRTPLLSGQFFWSWDVRLQEVRLYHGKEKYKCLEIPIDLRY